MTAALIGILLVLPCSLSADAIKPSEIYVIDGDTIEALGMRVRLVGFDAPELGKHKRERFHSENKKLAKTATEIRKIHAKVVPSHFLLSGPPAWPTHCG
jgi:endonuclease YncB( thermonuclease family)